MSRSRATVEVTAGDLQWAIPRSSGGCAVARAVKRAFPDASRVMVDIQTIRMTLDGERLCWITPGAPVASIAYFDAGEAEKLHPFRFQLRIDKAQRIKRQVPATPEDAERRRSAAKARVRAWRNGEEAGAEGSAAGARTVVTDGEAYAPPRSRTDRRGRVFGSRALAINQAREAAGDLPPREEA